MYHKGPVEPEFSFSSAHEALLSLLYLKTGLIFIKPENENHLLFPDNLREYHNLMQLLKNMDSVVDETGKIAAEKSLLRKNLNQFKHYFLDSWVKQNLERSHQEDLNQFMDEPVESKNKLIYFKLMQYVEEVKKTMPNSIEENAKKTKDEPFDNYRIMKDTPSYNVSLANVFGAMNQLDLQKEYKNMRGAIGVAYSIIAFELMYFSNNLHELYNGKVFEFSFVENRTYGLYGKDPSKGLNIALLLKNLFLKTSDETISLMALNNKIKKILARWGKDQNIVENADEASRIAHIFSLIFIYLFIYNGYYAGVSDDGTTLGKKFYERAVYFKQGRYALAPSGFFYKMLNLKRVLELTLLEKLDNSIEIDEKGDIYINNEETTSDKDMNHWLVDKETDEWLFKSEEKLLKLKDKAETLFDKDFISAWIELLKVNALNEKPIEILPYCSFEVLKFISDEQVRRSVSKYRKAKEDSIRRFTHVETPTKKSTTGFNNDFYRTLLELKEKMAFSMPSNFDNEDVSKTRKSLAFGSPLSYYCRQYESVRSIFDLFKYYEFNINKTSKIGNQAHRKDGDSTTKIIDEQTVLKNLYDQLFNFYDENKDKIRYDSTIKDKLHIIKNQILKELNLIKNLNGYESEKMEKLEEIVRKFGNNESAKQANTASRAALDCFEQIIKLDSDDDESETTLSKSNFSKEA